MQSQHAKPNQVVATNGGIDEDENDEDHIQYSGFDGFRNRKRNVYRRC